MTICVTFGGIFVAAMVAYVQHLRLMRDLERERDAEKRVEASVKAS